MKKPSRNRIDKLLKPSRNRIDKLFVLSSHDLYDKFIENATMMYSAIFPDMCNSKDFDDSLYDMVRQRLMFELSVLFNEAKGEKNVSKKCKIAAKITIERTMAK